jgi:hypothetical protein
MTKLDYLNVIRAIDTIADNERILTDRYIDMNPDERDRCYGELYLILYALDRAKGEISRRYEAETKTATKDDRSDLLNLLQSYKRMIDRNREQWPSVLIDDIDKSIVSVLKRNSCHA